MPEPSDLSVIMRAKDLCRYIVTVTQKSPKQYRFTFTSRLQNLSMDVISALYMANETFVGGEDAKANYYKRLNYQREAATKLRLLAYLAEVAMDQKAILPRQYQQIALHVTNTLGLLGGWIKSDRNRFRFR